MAKTSLQKKYIPFFFFKYFLFCFFNKTTEQPKTKQNKNTQKNTKKKESKIYFREKSGVILINYNTQKYKSNNAW